MSKQLWCIAVSILGALLPNAYGLSAKAHEPGTFNSRPSAKYPMIVQSYECDNCASLEDNFYHFEAVGDSNKIQAYQALERKNHELAYRFFNVAIDNYQEALKLQTRGYSLEQVRNDIKQKISEAQQMLQEVEILRQSQI